MNRSVYIKLPNKKGNKVDNKVEKATSLGNHIFEPLSVQTVFDFFGRGDSSLLLRETLTGKGIQDI